MFGWGKKTANEPVASTTAPKASSRTANVSAAPSAKAPSIMNDIDADLLGDLGDFDPSKYNDSEFDDELAELGFDNSSQSTKKSVTQHSKVSKPQQKNLDIPQAVLSSSNISVTSTYSQEMSFDDSIGVVDETKITLTEEDMNDPELLAEFDSVSTSLVVEESNAPPDEEDENMSDIDSLKKKALALSAQGRKEEALDIMRRIKVLGAQDVQKKIDQVVEISRQDTKTSHVHYSSASSSDAWEQAGSQQNEFIISNVPTSVAATTPSSSRLEASVFVRPDFPPSGSPAEAKTMAGKLKKNGLQDDALQWLRYAKQVEAGTVFAVPFGTIVSVPQAPAQLQRTNSLPKKAVLAVVEDPSSASNKQSVATIAATRPQSVKKQLPPVSSVQATPPHASVILESTVAPSIVSSRPISIADINSAFSALEAALTEAIATQQSKAVAAKRGIDAAAAAHEAEVNAGVPRTKVTPTSTAVATAKTTAAELLREYKRLQGELETLRSRRVNPNSLPASFRWESVRTEVLCENTHLADDQIELIIENLREFDSSLSAYSHRSISISYNVGFPKEEPITGNIPTGKYINNEGLTWNFKVILPLKRGSTLKRIFETKKVNFDIILHRGIFGGGDLTIGAGSLPLADLVTKTSCGGTHIPLFSKESKGKNIGGVISAFLKIRTPLTGREIRYIDERRLVVDPWPSIPVLPSAVQLNPEFMPSAALPPDHNSTHPDANRSIQPPFQQPTTENQSAKIAPNSALVPQPKYVQPTLQQQIPNSMPTRPVAAPYNPISSGATGSVTSLVANLIGEDSSQKSQEKAAAGTSVQLQKSVPHSFSAPTNQLTEQEREDPLSVEFLESSDVMDAEIEIASREVSKPGLNEDEKMQYELRIQLITVKLGKLVSDVQNESLSLPQYVDRIKDRLKRDKLLALHCKTYGDVPTATKIMRRIKIMEAEIQNVENNNA